LYTYPMLILLMKLPLVLCTVLMLHTINTYLLFFTVFSSPEHKVLRVSYCDRSLSVVRRRPSCVVRCASCGVRRPSCVVRKLFYLNIFSSETTHWILTKLHRNDPWEVPYQSCSNCSSWLHK